MPVNLYTDKFRGGERDHAQVQESSSGVNTVKNKEIKRRWGVIKKAIFTPIGTKEYPLERRRRSRRKEAEESPEANRDNDMYPHDPSIQPLAQAYENLYLASPATQYQNIPSQETVVSNQYLQVNNQDNSVPSLYPTVPNKYPTSPIPDRTVPTHNVRHTIVPDLHQPHYDEEARFQEVPRSIPYQGAAGGVAYQPGRGGGEYQGVAGDMVYQGDAAAGVGYHRQPGHRAAGKYV